MTAYGDICHCLHGRKRHLGDEICIADGCECARYKPKGRRSSRGLGADVASIKPASLDAPVGDDGERTLGDVIAEKPAPEDDEDAEVARAAIVERGKEAYIEYVTRTLRATAERQWAEYIMFVQGAPLTKIAEQSGYHVATVYEAINRIREFLRSEFGVDTPKEYRRPDMLLERKRAKARDLLRNTRLTQRQIAKQTGLSQCTISKICQQMESQGETRGRGLQELSKRCRRGHDLSLPDAFCKGKQKRLCRLCYNDRQKSYQQNRKARAA